MRHSKVVNLSLFVKPYDLSQINDNMDKLLNEKYENSIFKDLYIYNVESILNITGGKIAHNGSVYFLIKTCCSVIDIVVGEPYDISINSFNKMGAMYNIDKCTIFIPIQYFNGFSINSNSFINVKILGKRIADNIVCVASILKVY